MSVIRKPMKTISLKLPESLDRLLGKLSKERHTSRSLIVREALQTYIRAPGNTVASLASDLIGVVEGPSDLSTSDRHLNGYGR